MLLCLCGRHREKGREEFEPARSTLVGDPRTVCGECDDGE